MKTTRTVAMAITMGFALSGCQMLFGQRTAKVDSANDTLLAEAGMVANPALEQGKQLLRAGRTAQAIELLRVAQRDPTSMADASNALGVAYAKLGRHDLADRYFRMAISLQPGDARFAANMLRLQRDYDLAERRNEEAARMAARVVEQQRVAEMAIAEQGKIERVSRGEVQIRTDATPARLAPRMEVLARRSNVTKDRTGIQIQTKSPETLVEAEEKPKSRSLTLDFAKERTGRSSKSVNVPAGSSDNQYPVRVYIGA